MIASITLNLKLQNQVKVRKNKNKNKLNRRLCTRGTTYIVNIFITYEMLTVNCANSYKIQTKNQASTVITDNSRDRDAQFRLQ